MGNALNRNRRAAALLVAAALCLGAILAPASASAAEFLSQPKSSTSGVGPFTWTFKSSESEKMSGVAYKLSTEQYWHRCTTTHEVTLSNLPDGTYTLEIADDLNKNLAGNQIYSGTYAHCLENPPPSAPAYPTISVSSFTVGAPGAPPPHEEKPSGGSNTSPSAACTTARARLTQFGAALTKAKQRLHLAKSRRAKKRWSAKLRRAKSSLVQAGDEVRSVC